MDEINVIGRMDHTIDHTFESANRVYGTDGIAPAMNTCGGGGLQPKILECKCIGGISDEKWGKQYHQQDRVYSMGDVAMCQPANIPQGSYKYLEVKHLTEKGDNAGCFRAEQSRAEQSRAEQSCLIRQATKEGTIECDLPAVVDTDYPTSKTRRGRVIERGQISPTLTTGNIPSVIEPWVWEIDGQLYRIRIRRLTPKECFRLMSFSDEDYDKASGVCSDTQLYKQAGNSIVEECLKNIFRQMM